jgi:hypothetical protein
MERPDIEDYINKINGSKGMALVRHMEHVGMKPLLDYIIYLENNLCKCSKEIK